MKLQTFAVFTPIWVRWEDFQLDLRIFFRWVVQPPTRYVLCLWPNSNQNQRSCGGFKLFTAINLLGKMEIQSVKMKLNLRPAIDWTSNLFKQNPSCRLCKSLTPFEASFTAFIWQWNMTTIKWKGPKQNARNDLFFMFLMTFIFASGKDVHLKARVFPITLRPGFNLGDPANGLCLGCPVDGQPAFVVSGIDR